MPSPPRISDADRRARLVARHHLDGGATDVVTAVRGVVAMHASDATTPYLGIRARLGPGTDAIADLQTALHDTRSLWRLHAIRRTIFIASLEDAMILEAAAGREVARRERAQLHRWLAAELPAATDPAAWEAGVTAELLEVLADGVPRRTTELAGLVQALGTHVTMGSGRWSQRTAIASRLLLILATDGVLVRAHPVGTWRSGQYHWTRADRWFVPPVARVDDEAEGRARLATRYLATHGPATSTDLRWWAGWTVARTRAALAAVGAVEVALDDGAIGHVLPGDVATDHPLPSHVALLPGLDPTPMGWKERGWYLGPHGPALFDTNGNIGPSVWVDGRIVGGWAVRDDGQVVYRALEDLGGAARAALDGAAEELTAWLGGGCVIPRFRTPLERELTA